MAVTMFGGSDTSYTEVGGIPQPGVNGQVYATATGSDRIFGTGGLMAADGVTPTDVVTADSDGFYLFGIDNHPGDVYLDFGRGRKRVHPADIGNRIASLEAGGVGGGGTGAVSSVAGRQGAIILDTGDIAGLAASLALKADIDGGGHIPVAQIPQKYAAAVKQVGIATVASLTPGGIPFSFPTTLAFGVVTSSRAARGSSITVAFYTKDHLTQTYSTPVVATLAVGARSTFVVLSTSVLAQDKWYADITAVGSTEPGGDITVQVIGVGGIAPPTALAAPNPPTGLTIVNTTSTSNTVSWTAPAGGAPVSGYTLYRTPAGGALTFVASLRGTSILDSGLTAGTSYTYTVVAQNDDACSTDVVSSLSQYMTSATLASDWTIRLGTSTSPAPAITLATNTVSISTGSAGTFNVQDTAALVYGGANQVACTVRMPVTFSETTGSINLFLSSSDFPTAGTSWTNGVQIAFGYSGFTIRVKAPSYNSGSSYVTTASTTSPAQATVVGDSAGHVAWTTGNMSLSTKYYVTAELLHVGTGTYGGAGIAAGEQILNLYLAPATGGPVLQEQIKLSATQRTAIATGKVVVQFSGASAAAVMHYTLPTNGSDFTIAAN